MGGPLPTGADARLVNIVGTSVSPRPPVATSRSTGSRSRTDTTSFSYDTVDDTPLSIAASPDCAISRPR